MPKTKIVLPDNNRLSWDDYFMAIAKMVSLRSPDPNTKVGSVLVDAENKIRGTGYNGLPRGVDPKDINWAREGKDELSKKYIFVIHSEANTLLNASGDLNGSRLYVSLFPCADCAKMIIQRGIKKVYYLCNPYAGTDSVVAATKMFKLAGVKVSQFKSQIKKLTINLEC